jgi:methionine-rich copper-binding protein CopC
LVRPIQRASFFVLITLALLLATSQLALAHAILMESTPAANSTVSGQELAINLRFNVRIDGGRSRLRLVAADGAVSNIADVKQTQPDTLQASASGLKAGSYTLRWQVLASDGHMSRGEVPFTVK